MKTKIIFSIIFFITAAAFVLTNMNAETGFINTPPTNDFNDSFFITAMALGSETDYSAYSELGFNLWSKYTESFNNGWTTFVPGDTLYADSNAYLSGVSSLVGNNQSHGMRTLLDRIKVQYLAYGQRSDYQCEVVSSSNDRWFYAYSTHQTGSDVTDSGTTVRRCLASTTSPDFPGYVVKKLKANSEQCYFWGASYYWNNDTTWKWYVKPRIRIDSSFAHNNQNDSICRIDILDFDSNVIKSVTLKGRNFLKQVGNDFFYNGQYLEEFYGLTDSLTIPAGRHFNPHDNLFNSTNNGVDFRVYWYGLCNMWIDYVRVDNEIADQLFKHQHDDWLRWEVHLAQQSPGALKFYIEEFFMNNTPCMAYVNKKIRDLSSEQFSLMCDLNLGNYMCSIPDVYWAGENVRKAYIKRNILDSVGLKEFFTFAYPFFAYFRDSVNLADSSFIPNTLPVHGFSLSGGRFAEDKPPSAYDAWLQPYFDYQTWPLDIYFTARMKLCDSVSKYSGLPFIPLIQTHLLWEGKYSTMREPTNEELDMMVNLNITYGARAILYFWYPAWGCVGGCPGGDPTFSRGLTNPGNTNSNPASSLVPRDTNAYGQLKWQKIKTINQRLHKWGPSLMQFNDTSRHSYIFRLENERTALINNSYFFDLLTYKISTATFECTEDYPDYPSNIPAGWIGECKNDRYLQVATYKIPNDPTPYFMVVNRRCSPFKDGSNETNNGGRRRIKARISANRTEFANYNNWKIIDIGKDSTVATFDKRTLSLNDLGEFKPGEGKLFKIVPVPVKGGILVADEVIENQTYTCEKTVWTNGHDFRFKGHGNTVTFLDSAKIIMEGGTFISDTAIYSSGKNLFKAQTGHFWDGFSFEGTTIKMYNASFQDISSPTGGNFAVSTVDCPLNDFRFNTFTSSTDTAGGVSITFISSESFIITPDNYIMYNTFTMGDSRSRAIQVQGFAGLTSGTYIKSNTMTSNGYADGILLTTITGGVVKQNSITGFATGINTVLSSVDMYANYISNTNSVSKGIFGVSGSNLNLAPSGGTWVAGQNTSINSIEYSNNLEINNSNFTAKKGENTFDTYVSNSNHFSGYFWGGSFDPKPENNCFKSEGNIITESNLPYLNVTDYNSNPVSWSFFPYDCEITTPDGSDIVDIGEINDTIPTSSGYGGGLSSKQELLPPDVKTINDSIHIQMRHRNYSTVKTLCLELIDTYPDSMQSIASLQTLFMVSTAGDTTSATASALKIYYENLILNHRDNHAMVKISNYLVQKCKVLLHQYSSAMSGFQEIINNNPYSYEGLLARWDYMATSLLLQGHGGGERDYDNGDDHANGFGVADDDKNPFTKEQRQVIRQSVSDVIQNGRILEEQKIIKLIEGAKEGNENDERELKEKMILKEIVKTERPRNRIEHLNIVNSDIQKVFGSKVGNSGKTGANIPHEFSLSQNYPNPFNPITKIKYELPKDIKVVIKVYDILGREVITLVNEFKKAGYYENDFNGSNFASGVYFYRLEAGDFVRAKKMVLVK